MRGSGDNAQRMIIAGQLNWDEMRLNFFTLLEFFETTNDRKSFFSLLMTAMELFSIKFSTSCLQENLFTLSCKKKWNFLHCHCFAFEEGKQGAMRMMTGWMKIKILINHDKDNSDKKSTENERKISTRMCLLYQNHHHYRNWFRLCWKCERKISKLSDLNLWTKTNRKLCC